MYNMIVFKSFFIFIIFFLFIIKDTYAATPKKNKSCEKVIETIEDLTDIPKNLLLSIGKSESGRILKNKHGSWDKAIKHYHSSDPKKNKPYLIKVNHFWKIKEDTTVKSAINIKKKEANTNSLSSIIKDRQPYLFARIEKVKFFRNIFSQN